MAPFKMETEHLSLTECAKCCNLALRISFIQFRKTHLTLQLSYPRWLFIGVLFEATTNNQGCIVTRNDKHNISLLEFTLTLETNLLTGR